MSACEFFEHKVRVRREGDKNRYRSPKVFQQRRTESLEGVSHIALREPFIHVRLKVNGRRDHGSEEEVCFGRIPLKKNSLGYSGPRMASKGSRLSSGITSTGITRLLHLRANIRSENERAGGLHRARLPPRRQHGQRGYASYGEPPERPFPTASRTAGCAHARHRPGILRPVPVRCA
jgi:hypothetical protein